MAAAAREAGREPGLLRRLQDTELSSSPRSLTHSTAVLLLLLLFLALPPGEHRLCAGGGRAAVLSPGSPGPRHGCKGSSGFLMPPPLPPPCRAGDTMTNLRREEEAKEEGEERQRRPRLPCAVPARPLPWARQELTRAVGAAEGCSAGPRPAPRGRLRNAGAPLKAAVPGSA